MDNIWIIEHRIPYEGARVYGVHRTLEGAVKSAEAFVEIANQHWQPDSENFYKKVSDTIWEEQNESPNSYQIVQYHLCE